MRLRRTIAVLAIAAAGLGACGGHTVARDTARQGTSASCAAPTLAARPFGALAPARRVVVRPGELLRLHGRYYTHDCFDSGPAAGRRDRPAARVLLDLVPAHGRTTTLAVAHPAGPSTSFVITVRIPREAPPGRARIEGRRLGGSLLLRVRRGAN